MTPQAILAELWADGITLRIAADGANLLASGGRLSAAQRALIVTNKPELLAFLAAAKKSVDSLLAVAMLACDHHADDETGRQRMRDECLATPPHLQEDLRHHLAQVYRGGGHERS